MTVQGKLVGLERSKKFCNKFTANETIAIENKGKVVTNKSKLVNLFDSHYVNIAE